MKNTLYQQSEMVVDFFNIRYKIGLLIVIFMEERSNEEINKIWSWIISSEIRQIKEWLWMSEWDFLSFDPKKSDKSLQWWMYSILDDLMRFQIKIISMEELFDPKWQIIEDEQSDLDNKKWMNFKRLILESYHFELDMWHRKFHEHFVQLIHLMHVTENERQVTAEIYYLSGKLLGFANRLKDDNDSYWIKNEAEAHGFWYEFQEIKGLLEKLWGTCVFIEAWFNEKDARKFKVFCSHKSLYDELFRKKLVTENDRLLLGGTYHYYHRLTQSIHALWHNYEEDIELEDIWWEISHIFLLSMKMLYYIWKISSIKSSHHIKLFAESPLPEWMDFTIQKYERWDLVMFRWWIYEILDFNKQQDTWYMGYQIETKSGIRTSNRWVRQEDQYLKRVLHIGNARKIVTSFEWVDESRREIILSMPDKELFFSLKAIVQELYKNWINVFSWK